MVTERSASDPRPRSIAAAVLSLALTGVLVSGCGQTVTDPDGAERRSPSASPSPSPSSSPSPSPSSKLSLDPSYRPCQNTDCPEPTSDPTRGADEPRLLEIDSVEQAREPRTALVHYTLPTPCTPGLARVEVREDGDLVQITLHQQPPQPRKGMECAQVLVEETTTVRLDRPLRGRTVIDGSTGEPVQP